MANPIVAGVGMGASLIGGIFGAEGALEEGQAQANMYNYQASVARLNQQIDQQNANYTIQAGEGQAQEVGMRNRQTVGAEKAGFGSGNIDVNTGSASDVTKSQIEVGQQEEAVTRANAAKRAYGYEVEGVQDKAQSDLDILAGQNAQVAAEYGATASLLGAASSVSSKWMQASSMGMFSS